MNRVSFFLLIVLAIQTSYAQHRKTVVGRIISKLISDTTSASKPSFRIYPTLGYAPETSIEFGFSSMLLYHAKGDTLNRMSEVNAFTFITLHKQYGLWFDNAIYADKDKWFILGKTRFQEFPLLYFGIGPNSTEHHPAIVNATYLLVRQRIVRQVMKNFFIGPTVDFQKFYNAHFEQPDQGVIHPLPVGYQGSTNVGLGIDFVYDNRHNVLNVRKGFFSDLSFLAYRKAWGSNYHFNGITSDTRLYRPIRKNEVLAFQLYGNLFSGEVPFNQMALLGGDMIMRGYYQGRYRDHNLLASQIEYRWLPFGFSKRIGGNCFWSRRWGGTNVKRIQGNSLGRGRRITVFNSSEKRCFPASGYGHNTRRSWVLCFYGGGFLTGFNRADIVLKSLTFQMIRQRKSSG
ncbi:MAG: BamA/TamA family outer membrane protein [Siphonobacter sp.]